MSDRASGIVQPGRHPVAQARVGAHGAGGGVGRRPPDARVPDLDPGVRVRAAQGALVARRFPAGEAGRQPGRHPDGAQQHHLGGRELLAEAGVRHEQEVVDGVRTRRRDGRVEPVGLVRRADRSRPLASPLHGRWLPA